MHSAPRLTRRILLIALWPLFALAQAPDLAPLLPPPTSSTEAVRNAVAAIDDIRQSSIREVQELFPTRVQAATTGLATRDEIAAVIASQWKEEMDKYRSHAEELTQKLANQAADLKRALDRCQEFLGKMSSEVEPQVHARLNEAVARAAGWNLFIRDLV